jgi:hypothetical protein
MIIQNKLPDRYEASVMTNCISPDEIKRLLDLLPLRDQWYLFKTDTVSRTQSRTLSPKEDPETLTFINQALARVGLEIDNPVLHPRLYQQGDFMDWHSDYDHLPFDICRHQYECTLVLFNSSDSVTCFKDHITGQIDSYSSHAGELLVVRRHGIRHSVSPITNEGHRMMIKISCKLL